MNTAADALLAAARDRIPEGRVVVALSGGADSAVVAWLAVQAIGASNVRAVHVNHAQPASDVSQIAAAQIASELGVRLQTLEVQVPQGASFENQARNVRLAAIEAEANDDESIITGHQADDQAETVIANLARGAGARGMSGIPFRRNRYVRPLLRTDRASVRSVAEELGLPFVDDPANEDPSHMRNRIRHDVIPAMESAFGYSVVDQIGRSGANLAADDATLEAEAASIPVFLGYRGAVMIPAALLSVSPVPVAMRAIRRGLRLARPPYAGSSEELWLLLDVAGGVVQSANLADDFMARREGPHLVIFRPSPDERLDPKLLTVPGRVAFGPVEVSASTGGSVVVGRSSVVAAVETDGLVVRAAVSGERIDIRDGSKLVRDAMAEADIPKRLRGDWPVVARDGRIIWIAGVRLATSAAVGDPSRTPLLLKMERRYL